MEKSLKFDDLLEVIGEFGPYQKWIFVLVSMMAVVSGLLTMSPVFLLDIPNYRCAIPSYKHDTYAIQSDYHGDLINLTIPMETDSQGERTYSKCKLYNVTDFQSGANKTEYNCDAWVFDTSVIQTTGITEFNMVCDNEILRSHSNMMSSAGGFPGAIVLGPLSDLFGRKKTLLLSVILTVATSVAAALSPTYEIYVVSVFLNSFATLALFMVAFVIAMELVGPSKRTFVGVVIEFFWVGGLFLLTMLAYFIRDWRHLRLAIGVPPIIFLTYWWLIPESPRWLMSKGKTEGANEILRKIAKSNKVDVDDATLRSVTTDTEDKTVRFWKMFTSPVLLIRTVVILINWCSINIVYYGLSLNVGNLSGDIYLNFFVSSLMELVAYAGCLVLLNRVGRKPLLCFNQLLGGAACLATIFPVLYGNTSTYWTIVTLSMLGKLGSSAAFAVIYIFAAELFPTVVRQSSLAVCSMFGMVGGMVAPYIADLGILVKGPLADALPLIVFGSLTISAGLTLFLLPETRNKILPDTIEDAIAFGNEKIQKIRDSLGSPATSTSCQSFTGQKFADFHPVSVADIEKLIHESKLTTCPLDPVPSDFLLRIMDVLLPVLTKIINASLSSGIVPQCFKSAVVKPLLKKPSLDCQQMQNYRPVSNLPFLSKVLEKVVKSQIVDHLAESDLMDEYQSAYRSAHSTETALNFVMNNLMCTVDEGKLAMLVLLDLSAAFDTIDHDVLIRRLEQDYGLDGTVLIWCISYLWNRTQSVAIGNIMSRSSGLSCGVPQGSVLGPLLFTLYTKPLGTLINEQHIGYHFYADDSQLMKGFAMDRASQEEACLSMESCVITVKSWMNDNMLKLNDTKTELIVFSPPVRLQKCSIASLTVDQESISSSNCVKNLGVYFDSSLTMENHISYVCKTCRFHFRNIGSIRHLSRNATATLMRSLILSRLDYCNSLLFWCLKRSTSETAKAAKYSCKDCY